MKVVRETLLFSDTAVGGVVNDGTDQSAAVTRFHNLVNTAGRGHGIYDDGQIHVTPLNDGMGWLCGGPGSASDARIEGGGGGGYPSGGATEFIAISDSGNPFVNPMFTVGGGNGGDWRLRNISIAAHQRFGPGGGIIPASLAGVQIMGNGRIKDINCIACSAAVILNGDHLTTEPQITGNGCGCGVYVPPNIATQGDIQFDVFNVGATLANIMLASSSKIGGLNTHRYTFASSGGLGILRFDDGVRPASQLAIGTMYMENCGFEGLWHGWYLDELFGTASAAQLDQLIWAPAPTSPGNICYQSAIDSNHYWGCTATVTAVSGSQVTVTVPAGFYVRPGIMQIVDGTGHISGGTTVQTILSGTWPATSYTLQLSSSPSAGTSYQVKLQMPQLAPVVAGLYTNEQCIASYLNGGYGTMPVYMVNQRFNCVADSDIRPLINQIKAGQPYVKLINGLGSQHAWGNQMGSRRGSMGPTMEIAQVSGSISQYDAVELVGSGQTGLTVQQATGTGKFKGVALRTASSGAVEVVVSGDQVPASNKTVSDIAAGTILKPDSTNHGGFVAATGNADPLACGIAGTILPAGTSTGTALIW